jgi:hypothetical protein
LSILRPPPEVLKNIKVGDSVRILEAAEPSRKPTSSAAQASQLPAVATSAAATSPSTPTPTPTPTSTSTSTSTPVIATARPARATPDVRFPAPSPFAPRAEVDFNIQQRIQQAMAEGFRRGQATAKAEIAAAAKGPTPPVVSVEHHAPATLYRGMPAQLAFAIQSPRLEAGWLYYRSAPHAEYKRVALEPAGVGYLRASLPPAVLAADHVEYFSEGTGEDHAIVPLYASAQQPTSVTIDDPDPIASVTKDDRSEVRLSYQYVDFNRLQGNDRYWVGEGSFLYRFGGRIYSLRMGAGAYDGVGGPREQIDQGAMPRAVGFNFGYSELEIKLSDNVSTLWKVLAGLTDEGLGGGLMTSLRFGDERGTNLLVGGQVASRIGSLAMAKLTWNVIREFPMAGTVELTNEPVATDLGVRMLLDIGWQHYRFFRPTLTLGYSVRAVNHGGPTLGFAQVFSW